MRAIPKRLRTAQRARRAYSDAGDRTMMAPHAGLERRVLAALEATPPRIPVVLGGCGTGRTTLLHALADRLGRDAVPVHRRRALGQHARALPSRALDVSVAVSTARPATGRADVGARGLRPHARASRRAPARGDRPATFLLDEVLELRTFESFPGLRHVLRELLEALAASGNRFVLTSALRRARASAAARRRRALRGHPPAAALARRGDRACCRRWATRPADDREFLGRTVQALTDGRAAYVRALGEATAGMSRRGGDPISALTALLTAERRADRLVRLSLRAAAASRARLRRAQGDSRDPRGGRAAHAHRDRAAPAPHAGLDQGLPVVARGRGSDRRAAEALQLRRPAAAPVGAPALPPRAAVSRRSRARSADLRAGAPAAGRAARWRWPAPVPASGRSGASSRSTDYDAAAESSAARALAFIASSSDPSAPPAWSARRSGGARRRTPRRSRD